MNKSCPCLFVEPCSPQCTCRYPHHSGGCQRCCSYGSEEQQLKAAEFLARVIDEAIDKQEISTRVVYLCCRACGKSSPVVEWEYIISIETCDVVGCPCCGRELYVEH